MASTKSIPCPACGEEFPTKWAMEHEHRPKCPLNSGSELRLQEEFERQQGKIEKSVTESYSYAARALSSYLNGESEHARLFHTWLHNDMELVTSELALLTEAAKTKRVQHPRMKKTRDAISLLIEQAQDLIKILGTINREYGFVVK